MELLGMIIAAILGAVLVAFLIVKFLPLKLRWIPSLLLLALTIYLGVKIYDGIMKPINFNIDKKEIYSEVINNLKIIRDAEMKFYEANGTYTDDKNLLIKFIDTAQLAITETNTIVVEENKGTKWQPLMIEVEKRVIDTIGYSPVINYFKNKDYKNMFKVPGLEGTEFEIRTGFVEKIKGLRLPTFEARVPKAPLLEGKDPSLVKQELERVETDEIKGAYISVGSLEEVTTGGNWPPFYDKNDVKNEE